MRRIRPADPTKYEHTVAQVQELMSQADVAPYVDAGLTLNMMKVLWENQQQIIEQVHDIQDFLREKHGPESDIEPDKPNNPAVGGEGPPGT